MEDYRTIAERSTAEVEEKHSRFIALAAFADTPAGKSLYLRLREGRVKDALSILGLGAVFLLCTAALASQSYNPFIYFRF